MEKYYKNMKFNNPMPKFKLQSIIMNMQSKTIKIVKTMTKFVAFNNKTSSLQCLASIMSFEGS